MTECFRLRSGGSLGAALGDIFLKAAPLRRVDGEYFSPSFHLRKLDLDFPDAALKPRSLGFDFLAEPFSALGCNQELDLHSVQCANSAVNVCWHGYSPLEFYVSV